MNEWNIQSRARACQGCGDPFADKQPYHTLLFEEKQEYHRQDICPACWESQYRQGASERKGFVSQWQGIYHSPPAGPVEAIQKESAESLLRKLIEANDAQYGPVCYILAAMLERKRILKVKEQIHREGARVFIYEHPKSGDLFTIADPNLQLDQLEEVQRDTARLLAQGLNPPPAEPGVPAPSSAGPANEDVAAAVSPKAAETEPAPAPAPIESLGANP